LSDIVFSEARPGDEEAIAAFHRFDDPGLFTREYWSYRARDSVFVIGKDADRIVASEALMPYELSVCGKRMLTGRSERTLVDPAYRGRNIWQDIMAFCAERGRERGMAFIWGSTGARKPFENAGYTFLSGHRLHMYSVVSVRGVKAYIARMSARGAFNPARLRERIARHNSRELEEYAILAAAAPSLLLRGAGYLLLPGWSSTHEITAELRSFTDLEDLYRRLGVRERDIYLPQDEAFFQWLLARSKIDCSRYFAYAHGALAGYAYVSRGDAGVATIFDFAFEDGRAASALFRRVRADLNIRDGAFIKISFNSRNSTQRRYLAAAAANGFVPLHRGGSHVVMPLLYSDQAILNDMSRWYLTDLSYIL
jgi:GNAT superfamily N-acetyltransferase